MHLKTSMKLAPITLENAAENVKKAFEITQSKFGFIPNMYRNMANSSGAFATYLSGYNAFRELSGFTSAEQEVVFLTISQENNCAYCVAAHATIANKMSGVPAEVIYAICHGEIIHEPKLAALSYFTRRLVQSRGLPNESEIKEFLQAGFKEEQVLEVVLAIAVKTISNYTNHLFNTPIDAAFAGNA
ncbi:carboxymuconolactone decarboxylase family protein [mine drainage metagenome]|uniref:Carboxymuconolactone decarboxylase family protein n=1 Tax=mine drainage metagenome TaxID=410659 RepID=A0A1J5QKS0_9ZZZZ